jgi:hypothetical protein
MGMGLPNKLLRDKQNRVVLYVINVRIGKIKIKNHKQCHPTTSLMNAYGPSH